MSFKSGDTNCVLQQKQELCTVKYSDVYRIIRKFCTVEFINCVQLNFGIVYRSIYKLCTTGLVGCVLVLTYRSASPVPAVLVPLYLYVVTAVPVHIFRRTCTYLN